ncbi:hypothetical protein TNCT_31451 [Trichonephila clavata]|uniref:Uncharacterized protein n=1 Tax=Trichonephila clavata TaxID=2740835 RepID=A0A8X6L910_TRICU|nr:hypothetical protein TNCT_31451 [Trichonephila clavata]
MAKRVLRISTKTGKILEFKEPWKSNQSELNKIGGHRFLYQGDIYLTNGILSKLSNDTKRNTRNEGQKWPNGVVPYTLDELYLVRWVGKFQQGLVSTSDEQRSRRPLSVRTDLARAVIELSWMKTDDGCYWS